MWGQKAGSKANHHLHLVEGLHLEGQRSPGAAMNCVTWAGPSWLQASISSSVNRATVRIQPEKLVGENA